MPGDIHDGGQESKVYCSWADLMVRVPIKDIDHIEIFVKDRQDAAKWYEKVFGLVPVARLEQWASTGPLIIGNTNESIKLALFNGVKDNDGSVNRIAFSTSGERFVDFLNGLENTPVYFRQHRVTKKDLSDHNLSFSIYFDDPDGNKLELTSYDYEYVRSAL